MIYTYISKNYIVLLIFFHINSTIKVAGFLLTFIINIDGYENTNLAVIITGHATATTTWKIEADALSVPTNYST